MSLVNFLKPGTAERLCEECRKIHSVSSWEEFYTRLGLPAPSPAEMTEILRNAIRRSEAKGYHISRVSQVKKISYSTEYSVQQQLFEWRSQRDLLMETGRDLAQPALGKEADIEQQKNEFFLTNQNQKESEENKPRKLFKVTKFPFLI